MADASDLPVRAKVDEAYERVVDAIFMSVQQIAKMDKGDGRDAEDKGQLNYHVVMIGEIARRFIFEPRDGLGAS